MPGDLSQYFPSGFNAESIDTRAIQGEFDPLPPGWYPLRIDTAEVRKTQKGDGTYVSLETTVLSGQYAGRKVFDRIMLQHPNQDAVTMGHARLATLAKAIHKPSLDKSASLIGCKAEARVVIGRKEYEGQKRNEVKEYRELTPSGTSPAPVAAGPSDGQTVGPSNRPPAAAPAAAPATPKLPPWMAGKAAAAQSNGGAA